MVLPPAFEKPRSSSVSPIDTLSIPPVKPWWLIVIGVVVVGLLAAVAMVSPADHVPAASAPIFPLFR